MSDRDGNRSNPYHLNPEKACEACVFGTGQHAEWCSQSRAQLDNLSRIYGVPEWDLSHAPSSGDIPPVTTHGV